MNRWLMSALLGALACGHPAPSAPAPASPPAELLGSFSDDYGDQFTVTPTEWTHHPQSRYHIVRWVPAGQYLIAQNDSTNPSARGRWTRIDWMMLPGMAPFTWGFCYSAYDAPTPEAAEATHVVARETPRTGCNGHPFSRMKSVASTP
ncbi:MAG: hypothetical protein ABJC74_13285 [Gemmatimonadota bacterium]